MNGFPRGHRIVPALLAFPVLLLATAGCVGYPAQGLVGTPTTPAETSGTSRLPQLLSQLQGGSAGLELFDRQNDVLAAQDEASRTPTAGKTTGDTPTPATSTPTPGSTTTPPTSLPLNPGTPTPTPATETATPTPTTVPTETVAPTETSTPVPTEPPVEPTPMPTIPTELTPATEG